MFHAKFGVNNTLYRSPCGYGYQTLDIIYLTSDIDIARQISISDVRYLYQTSDKYISDVGYSSRTSDIDIGQWI